MLDNAQIDKNHRVRQNIAICIRIWGNQYIISDYNLSNDCSVHANPNAIANYRRALSYSAILLGTTFPPTIPDYRNNSAC